MVARRCTSQSTANTIGLPLAGVSCVTQTGGNRVPGLHFEERSSRFSTGLGDYWAHPDSSRIKEAAAMSCFSL